MNDGSRLEVEEASFMPLVFTTTEGMGRRECFRYHSRLAELKSIKKGEDYAKTHVDKRKSLFLYFKISASLAPRLQIN